MTQNAVEIIAPGPLATIQDLGRTGHENIGVVRSGAADRDSLVAANRLVGNADGDAAIEITLGNFVTRFSTDTTVAVTGAACEISLDGVEQEMNRAVDVAAGQKLRIGAARIGLRIYLALRGGVCVPAILGSRSTDTLSGIGPPPLARGVRLPIGEGRCGSPMKHEAIFRDISPKEMHELSIVPGPRDDWFVAGALSRLCESDYVVTPHSNRTALRLAGAALERYTESELPPEALVPGAIQIPPSGQPILFLVDHPSTGGYPVVAVLRDAALPAAAQVRPGQKIRFALD